MQNINADAASAHAQPRVMMIGPHRDRKGGIAAVAASYLAHWDHQQYLVKYIPSSNDKNGVSRILFFLWSIVEFLYQSLFWRAEIVHIHFGWKASFYRKAVFVILARIFRTKVVLHCHASRFDLFYEGSPHLGQRFIRWILNLADLLLVVSQTWKEYFQSLSLNTPVCLLYNSVTLPQTGALDQKRRPIVLTLGRLGQRKGTYDILQAVPLVLETYPEAQFWLAGDGDINQIKDILAREPWGDQVQLLGWIKDEDKEQAFQQGSIFLLPSYHEGLPVAILEAMAYGLPVVSCPVGGIAEVVRDNETGFLLQPGDVLAIAANVSLLLNDADLRTRLGNNCRRLIHDQYDLTANLQHLANFYTALLTGKRPCSENPPVIKPEH